jgi:hypothetical protein
MAHLTSSALIVSIRDSRLNIQQSVNEFLPLA